MFRYCCAFSCYYDGDYGNDDDDDDENDDYVMIIKGRPHTAAILFILHWLDRKFIVLFKSLLLNGYCINI